MADKEKSASLRSINRQLDRLEDNMDGLYRATYASRTDNENDSNIINDEIEDNIDDIVSNINGQKISDISQVITRLQRKREGASTQLHKSLEELVTDNSIMDKVNMEQIRKFIQAENYQYDMILKYLPELRSAIEVMKDNVLSSDNFTKDFVTVVSNKSNKDQLAIFNSRAKTIKKKYKLQELFEEMYWEASVYGEYFRILCHIRPLLRDCWIVNGLR